MPTYEYRCPEGHQFEKLQKMSEPPEASCPICGRPGERLISGGVGFQFKGSGFYITDYGKDGKGPRKPEKESGGDTGAPEKKGKEKKDSTSSDKGGTSSTPSSKKTGE